MSSQEIIIKFGLGVSSIFFSGLGTLVGISFAMAVKERESIRKYPAVTADKIVVVFSIVFFLIGPTVSFC
jgi:hypothetical protein